MAELQLVDSTLFGEWDAIPGSPGEFFVGKELLSGWEEMRDRADWCMENLPYTGNLLLEDEDHRLLRECMSSYIFGLYSVAIISADAFLERIITDAVETYGLASGKVGSGKTLAAFGKLKIVDNFLFQRIRHLREIRNNLSHEKGPEHAMRLVHRALARKIHTEYLLRTDAKEAVSLAYGLAGKLLRNFPRLAIPGVGTPQLHRSPFKE